MVRINVVVGGTVPLVLPGGHVLEVSEQDGVVMIDGMPIWMASRTPVLRMGGVVVSREDVENRARAEGALERWGLPWILDNLDFMSIATIPDGSVYADLHWFRRNVQFEIGERKWN